MVEKLLALEVQEFFPRFRFLCDQRLMASKVNTAKFPKNLFKSRYVINALWHQRLTQNL